MIFKTTTNKDGQTKLETNLGNITEFFKKQNILSNSDIKAIKAYNKEIHACTGYQTAFIRTMTDASDKAKEMVAQANGNTVALDNLTKTSKAAAIGMKALSMAGNIFAGMAIALVGSKLFEGLDYLINYEEKQKQIFEKSKSSTEEAAKSILDLKSKMSDTSTKTSELSEKSANFVQGVNPLTNENKSLSTEQYEEFLDVNNQLAELFPSLTHNYDENGNAILGLSGDVDTVTASIKRLVEQQNKLAKTDMRKHLDEYVNGSDDADGIFKVLEGQNKEVKVAENNLQSLKDTYNGIIEKKRNDTNSGLYKAVAKSGGYNERFH